MPLLPKTHHFAADISESSEELPVIPVISADRPFISGTNQSKHSILHQRERRGKRAAIKKKKLFILLQTSSNNIFWPNFKTIWGSWGKVLGEKKKLPLVLGQTNWAESGLTGSCRWVMIWLPSSCSWFEHLNHDELCTASPVQVELPREQMFPRRLRAFPSSLQAPPSQRDRDAVLIRLASVTTGAQTAGACAGGESTGQIDAFKKPVNERNSGQPADVRFLSCLRSEKCPPPCVSLSLPLLHCHCQSFHAPVGLDKSKRARQRLFLLWSLLCWPGLIKGPLGCWMGTH